MSRLPRISLRKGSKVKPHQETETSFNESGSSAVSGAQAAPPDLVASGTPPGVRGSGSLVTSPVSPPSSLGREVLSPVRTSGASDTSMSKAERKRLAEAAERKKEDDKKRDAERKKEAKKAEKREKERLEAERKEEEKREKEAERVRQEAEKKAEKEKKKKEKEEKESKKSKGKKHDAKSLQDERSLHSEDWQQSSTLVTSQPSASLQHTPIPGAGYSQDMSGGRDALRVKSRHESGTASGVSVHGSHSIALETYEAEPRSVLSSSYDAGGFDEVRQSYQNTIDDLTHDLEAAKEESKKARDELEQELRRKEDELRALQMRKERELEEALEERDRTTREELRQKENELKLKDEEFHVAMQAKTEEYRKLLREQMEVKQREINEKQKETEKLHAHLNQKEKESAAASIVFKQEGELQSLRKEVEQKKDDLELQKRQHEIAIKLQREQLQALLQKKERDRKRSESEAVQTRESALQKVREELKQKTEEFEAERGVQQELLQASIQSEQRLRDIHLQMEKQKQEHTREMESTVKEQQAVIVKMKTVHQAEVETLQQQKDQALREALQQKGRESEERIVVLEEAQARHVQELKEKDARIRQLEAERQKRERDMADKDRGLRETVQQRRGESAGRITELETQHAKELTEKDAKIRQLEAEGRKRHREVMDESKKEQELQVKIQGMEKQHQKELEEKNRQVQRAIDEMRKTQEDALKMQKARIERRVETEQKKKLKETLDSAKTELEQAATGKAKAEIQRKEAEFQAAFAKSREELQQKEIEFQAAIQQRDQEIEARIAKLRSRHAQELVGKDLKIHQLQEEAVQFIPSSEPPDEAPQAQASRISVQSQEAHMDDLPSNVIDLAREISHFVDPENIIPQGKITREISPDEFHHMVQTIGSPAMLGAQKPQSFLFAVLPASNRMRSTLFDYTGCFGEIKQEQPGSPPYGTPEGGSPESSMPGSPHGSSFQEVQSTSFLSVSEAQRSLGESGCFLPPSSQRHGQMGAKPHGSSSAAVENLPDSVKVERLQRTVDGFQRLQADKEQQLKDKTSEVEELSEAFAKSDQHIVDLESEIEELNKNVSDLKANVEDQSRKVEERDRQIDALRKGGKASASNQKSREELDDYFEVVTKLTEQVTHYEAERKKQEREMNRLKELEGRIDEFEKQVFDAGSQLSTKEEEIKSKDEEIRRLQHDRRDGEEIQELEDEIDRLRPLETEIAKLKDDLRKAQQARVLQSQGESDETKRLRDECAQLKTDLEAAEREAVLLNAEVAQKDAQLSRMETEKMQKEHDATVKELDQATRGRVVRRGRPDIEDPKRQINLLREKVKELEEKLESRDADIQQLRQEQYPSVQLDPDTLEGLRSGREDPGITQLREILDEKEKKIHNLQQQVRSFESIIKDRHLLQGHSKEQSRAVAKLQQQLEATQSEKRVLEEVQYKDLEVVTQLEQAKEELKHVKEERDSACVKLQQVLTATEQESKKDQKVKSAAKLQLETEREKNEQLQLEIQGWETDVRRLETELNILKAEKAQRVGQVAETEDGISALQVTLSEAEHERQGLHHKYIQEKERCERAERECIELRTANHDLGIKISDMGLEVDELRTQAVSWKEAMQGQGVSVASLKDEMERLMRVNKELTDENEIRQQEVEYTKQDFIDERRDREQAAKHYDDEKARMNLEIQQLTGQVRDCLRDIDMYKGEIDKLKGELAHQGDLEGDFEAMQMELVTLREQADAHKAQQTAMKRELEESHQKLEENIANSSKLHDDVLVKTQQMKQYKKQVDGYKVQNGELKAEMDGLKAELGVYQQQAMQYKQQLAGAQQMGSNMEALQRERDTLAAQLQMLKSRKSSESEFATAFQKEFDRRDEFEKQNERLRAYCDRLVQENNELIGVLKHNNIPCPAPPPQPHPLAADVPRTTIPGGPVVPRSPVDQQRVLAAQQTVPPPSHFDSRHQHQPQYQHQHDYPPQQQHLQQERQPPASVARTNVPRDQGRVQQKPSPQQPQLKEASVCHQQAHLQQQELGGQSETQERVLHQQQLEQQQLAQREAHARALQQQQLEQQQLAQREAHARALQQQQLEQQQLAQREAQARALQQQQQQQLEQQNLARERDQQRQMEVLKQREQQQIDNQQQTQAHGQSEAVQQARDRRVLQQQHDIYRKQKGSQVPLKPQMKAYSVDDPRRGYGQPSASPQPHPHEGSHVPQERLLPNRPQMQPAMIRSNAGVQNVHPPNYRMPQQQGYPPPTSEYESHRQPSSLPGSINSMRHTADQSLRMQEGSVHPTATRAEQQAHRPHSGFVHSLAGHQQGITTNADASQFQGPIPRARIPLPSQQSSQPPQGRNLQQPNVAIPRNTPVLQAPAISQAPHGRGREIQGTVVPMQATNVGVERVSVPTQETNPNLPQQQAGIAQSTQDPKESLDKDVLMMKDLQGDIRSAAANVEAITKRGGGVSSEGDAIPLDPNLVCPLCDKMFRIGEIQKFRRHVDTCTGT